MHQVDQPMSQPFSHAVTDLSDLFYTLENVGEGGWVGRGGLFDVSSDASVHVCHISYPLYIYYPLLYHIHHIH